jgi:hypothetical protein
VIERLLSPLSNIQGCCFLYQTFKAAVCLLYQTFKADVSFIKHSSLLSPLSNIQADKGDISLEWLIEETYSSLECLIEETTALNV